MRTPMTITRGPNVYLATKAILQLLRYGRLASGEAVGDVVKTLAGLGLGTGVGRVRPWCAPGLGRCDEGEICDQSGLGRNVRKLAYSYTHDRPDIEYEIY